MACVQCAVIRLGDRAMSPGGRPSWGVVSEILDARIKLRWGTCVDCPDDHEGIAVPWLCRHFERGDHQLVSYFTCARTTHDQPKPGGSPK